jgi:hypothetical protein
MPVSLSLRSQLDKLAPDEKVAVADALWRQIDDQWQPSDEQLAELRRREDLATSSDSGTLPIGEEIQRLRR